ncbi:MAG: response regulator transcription factor [Anaerolineales bacterium]
MTRVVLADDQKSVRMGLRLLLEEEGGMEITGEAYNAGSLLTSTASNCPNLVLLDWGLPGMEPDQLVRTLRRICPDVEIIVLSGQSGVKGEALQAGADYFISKAAPPENLLRKIRLTLGTI